MNKDELDAVGRHHLRQLGLAMRKVELHRNMPYVLERDDILRKQGLDPVRDAYDYEKRKALMAAKSDILFEFQLSKTRAELKDLKKVDVGPVATFEMPESNHLNGERVAKLLETQSVPEVIEKLIENYQMGDYPPMVPDIAHGDSDNPKMQALAEEFEQALAVFAIDFLRQNAARITPKALIEFAKTDTSATTFDRMFK